MSVLGPLEEYSDDPGQVRDNIKYFYVSEFGKVAVNIDIRGKHSKQRFSVPCIVKIVN
jgi:hypothetical protein